MIKRPHLLPRQSRSCCGCSVFRVTLAAVVICVVSIPFVLLLRLPKTSKGVHDDDHDVAVETKVVADAINRPIHTIYTIGCGGASDSSWQLLQSTALDESFRSVGQRGKITRLVSGCLGDEKLMNQMSRSILPNLNVFFAPKQERVATPTNEERIYVQANRPTALRYFLNTPEIQAEDSSTVYAVIDPDFIFRQRIPEDAIASVREGKFVSHAYSLQDPAEYAFTACLEAFNQTDKAASCQKIKQVRSYRRYFAGVPYMLTRKDWLTLLDFWIPLIGPVLLRYPGIESDMISWAIAAALAGLESGLRSDFMGTCMSSERADVAVLNKYIFLHLCQSYYVPETRGPAYHVNPIRELAYIVSKKPWLDGVQYVFVFNKHWLRQSRLLEDCTVPLLLMPPKMPENLPQQALGYYSWHQTVLSEAVPAYNRAVEAFRSKIMRCEAQPKPGMALILHERRGGRYGGGWNHAIEING